MRSIRKSSRGSRATKGSLATGALLLGSLVTAGVAWAASVDTLTPTGNYDFACEAGFSANSVCKTDNASVYFYMDDGGSYELETPDRDNVNETLVSEYVPTDLSYTYDSTPVFTGAGETDTIYQEGSDLPAGAAGITWCSDEVDGGHVYDCDQQFVRILPNGEYTKKRACHESGHAVGLLHGGNSYPAQGNLASIMGCMRTPTSEIDSYDLGSNQVSRINSNY